MLYVQRWRRYGNHHACSVTTQCRTPRSETPELNSHSVLSFQNANWDCSLDNKGRVCIPLTGGFFVQKKKELRHFRAAASQVALHHLRGLTKSQRGEDEEAGWPKTWQPSTLLMRVLEQDIGVPSRTCSRLQEPSLTSNLPAEGGRTKSDFPNGD